VCVRVLTRVTPKGVSICAALLAINMQPLRGCVGVVPAKEGIDNMRLLAQPSIKS
jgi:hypothetical protein